MGAFDCFFGYFKMPPEDLGPRLYGAEKATDEELFGFKDEQMTGVGRSVKDEHKSHFFSSDILSIFTVFDSEYIFTCKPKALLLVLNWL